MAARRPEFKSPGKCSPIELTIGPGPGPSEPQFVHTVDAVLERLIELAEVQTVHERMMHFHRDRHDLPAAPLMPLAEHHPGNRILAPTPRSCVLE